MAKRNKALLMSIGTASGGRQEDIDNMARSLIKSIDTSNPELVVLFGSEASIPTIESMKEQYSKDPRFSFDFYEFIQIDEVDNFNKYYNAFKSKIEELEEDYRIVIDYTSGTKTMTMAAAFASMLFNKELSFVSGKRAEGKIIPGTEKVDSQNFFEIYDEIKLKTIREMFNDNRFESGRLLIDDLSENINKDIYYRLFDAYNALDGVDFEEALSKFDANLFASEFPEIEEQIMNNSSALSKIKKNPNGRRPYYILANLLTNAQRRADDCKYDDAIARLYRCLELIAQIKLEEAYGIDSSNVDMNIVRENCSNEEFIELLEKERDSKSGVVKIGLVLDYLLLYNFGDKLGKYYKNNEDKIQGSLGFRNYSILAHGLESKSEKEYEAFYNVVFDVAKVLNKKIKDMVEETKFPVFEI